SNGGSRGRGRADKGERAGRERRNDRERGTAAAENPGIAVPQAAPADNDHASGRGEGNRGTRDRRHRHRGGRNRRRGDKPQGGETPQPDGSVPRE
ncbi:ATP-dependent helicase, partial [Alistipes onderdonkii]